VNKFGALLVGLLLLLLVDCAAGVTEQQPGVVTNHTYRPPYTSTSCHTDGNGRSDCSTTYHQEEYELGVRLQDGHGMGFNVTASQYHATPDGTSVMATYRVGKWTGLRWPLATAELAGTGESW
jgi:hypothetical protein